MGDNLRLAAIGAFFLLVLAGIGFLVMQDDGTIPEVVPTSTTQGPEKQPSNDALALRSGRSGAGDTPALQNREDVSDGSMNSDDVEEAVANDVADDEPRNRASRPRGPGVVKGTVTWHGDGAPVSGAAILLDYVKRENSYDPYPDERAQWTARSNEDGEFRIANLPVNHVAGRRGGRLVVIASKDGASAVAHAGMTDDETDTLVELELRPTSGIGGQVLDGDGSPVTGAIVVPHEIQEKERERNTYGVRSLWVRTAADGRFQLDHMPEGTWTLAVQAKSYASVISDAFKTGETNAHVVLKKGSTVSGTVVEADGGDPVPNIFVTINDENNYRNQQRVKTDEEGAFHAAALADSDYVVHLEDENRILVGEPPTFTISDEEPVDGIKLAIVDGGIVSGMITDADTGNPIEGVRIRARGNTRSTNRSLEGSSDATGYYQITGMPGGSYTLQRRWKEGYLHGESRENKSVSVKLGEHLENIDFAVQRGLSVTGIVVDQQGEPVHGVNVGCQPLVDNGEGENITTKEDGTFAARGFSPNTEFNIHVSGRGYTAPIMGPLNTGETGLEDIKIVVEPGASIAGVVVDTTGKPLADMYVSAQKVGGGRGSGSESTGAEGTFHIKSLEEGTYQLSARKRNSWGNSGGGKEEVTVSQGQELTGVRVVFGGTDGATISGKVTNSKREPINNASVQAYSQQGGGGSYVQTEEDGTFELSVDKDRVYRVDVNHRDYSSAHRDEIAAGERNLNIELEGRGTVEGQVLDATTGRPIPNFEISHHKGHAGGINYQNGGYVGFFDEEGRFSISTVEAGEATIYARASGYAPTFQHIPYVEPDGVTGGIQFRLSPGASIEGVVLNFEGAPVAGARIFLAARVDDWMIRQGSGYGAVATSDANGAFTIDSVGDDLSKITAVHPDYPNTTVDVSLALGQATTVEIVMTGGATIEGTVSANGVPMANQHVYIQSNQGGGHQSTQSDANGFYTIEKVAAGEISVHARIQRDGATKTQSKTVTVQGGYTTTVDLNVEFGTAAVEGRLTVGGQPVNQAHVAAIYAGGDNTSPEQVQGQVSPDGTYRIEGLSAGTHRIMANAAAPGSDQRRMRMIEITVQDGQTVQLDIEVEDGAHIRGIISGVSDPRRVQVLALSGAVTITDPQTDMTSPAMQSLMAGYSSVAADGSYDLSGLDAGQYTVVALEFGQNGYADAAFATGTIQLGNTGDGELNLAIR